MKKKGILSFAVVFLFCMICSVSVYAAGVYEEPGSTMASHNWANPVKCHTISNEDGSITIIYSIWNGSKQKLFIDAFSSSGEKLSHKSMTVPGKTWGGTVYQGPDGCYYIATGNSDDVAFYISKYNANWELLGRTSIGKDESYTSEAYDAGNSDMTMVGDYLIVHAARGRQDGHQSNTTFYINKNTMKAVKAELARLEKLYPEDFQIDITYDATLYIESSIEEVIFTLVLTFALVIAVCYIFLQDWRATLIPSLTIPVSLFATFAVMLALGYSINLLTLFGLVLAIGLVVDDAIVVVERVLYLMETEKLSPKEATIKAMEQVSSAVIATTLVLLAIFVPVGFMGGITGKIYQQFAITISTAVAFSAINALTLSPALCATLLRPLKEVKSGPLHWFNVGLNKTRNRYIAIIAIVARKVSVIALILGLLVAGNVAFLKMSQSSFIPNEDQGVILANFQLPEGASLERTRNLIKELYPVMKNEEGVNNVMSIIGYSLIGGAGENVAFSVITLKPWNERKDDALYSTNILNRIMEKIKNTPEASINMFEFPAIPGLGASGGMDYRLQSLDSSDSNELYSTMQGFLGKLNSSRDIISYAYSTFTSQTPHINIEIEKEKAESMGIAIGDIYTILQNYLGSTYVNDVNFGTQVNKVIIHSD